MGLFGGSKESSPTKSPKKTSLVPQPPQPPQPQPLAEPSLSALLELRVKELEGKLEEQQSSTTQRISEAREEVHKARSEMSDAELRWSKEKQTLEDERRELLHAIDKLREASSIKATAIQPKNPLYLEVTINNVLFSRPFHFFIEAELQGIRDNTEVSEISECPRFVRTLVFRIKDADVSQSPPAVILSAKAFLDELTHKLLGTARVPLEPEYFDCGDGEGPVTPVAVQFIRNAAVYGKCVLSLRYFRSPNAVLSEPIKLEKPIPNGFPGVPTVRPKQYVQAATEEGVATLSGTQLAELERAEETTRILKEEVRAKQSEWRTRTSQGTNVSLSEEVISELSRLSNIELRDRLMEAVEKYKTERARLGEMRREIETVAAEKRSLEQEKKELIARLEALRQAPRVVDEIKYRETILEQEKVIRKLETIIETSVKKIQSAESLRVELDRLRVENKKLRNLPSQYTEFSADTGLKERVAALESQLIESAKRHAHELAQLKLAQSSLCCVQIFKTQ
jgi:hypothetical protein